MIEISDKIHLLSCSKCEPRTGLEVTAMLRQEHSYVSVLVRLTRGDTTRLYKVTKVTWAQLPQFASDSDWWEQYRQLLLDGIRQSFTPSSAYLRIAEKWALTQWQVLFSTDMTASEIYIDLRNGNNDTIWEGTIKIENGIEFFSLIPL